MGSPDGFTRTPRREAAAQHVAQQHCPELGGVPRGAEDGHPARREQRVERGHRGAPVHDATALPGRALDLPYPTRRTSGTEASRSFRSRAGARPRTGSQPGSRLHRQRHPVAAAARDRARSGTRGPTPGLPQQQRLDLAGIEVDAAEDHHVVGAAAQPVQAQVRCGRTRSGPRLSTRVRSCVR